MLTLNETLNSALKKSWEPLECSLDSQESITAKGNLPAHEALLYAVYFNQYDTVELLLKNPKDINEQLVNHQNKLGYTALTYALRHANAKMADRLLAAGAKLEYEAPNTRHHLRDMYVAICREKGDRFLTSNAPQKDIQEQLRRLKRVAQLDHDALHLETHQKAILDTIYSKVITKPLSKNDTTPRQQSVLEAAIISGDKRNFVKLLECGANPDTLMRDIMPPVWLCILMKQPELLKILLKKKPNLEYQNTEGLTALKLAICLRDIKSVKLLLQAGAKIDHPLQQSALLTSIKISGYDEIFNTLMLRKPNLTHTDHKGYTPLMYAVEFGRNDLVKQLIELGVDVNYKTANDESAFSIAISHRSIRRSKANDLRKYKEIVTLLTDAGAIMNKGNITMPIVCSEMRAHLRDIVLKRRAERNAVLYFKNLEAIKQEGLLDPTVHPSNFHQTTDTTKPGASEFLQGLMIWNEAKLPLQAKLKICQYAAGSSHLATVNDRNKVTATCKDYRPTLIFSNELNYQNKANAKTPGFRVLHTLLEHYKTKDDLTELPTMELALRRAAALGNFEHVSFLLVLDNNIKINEPDPNTGNTALDDATAAGNPELIALLLSQGAVSGHSKSKPNERFAIEYDCKVSRY